MFKRRHCQQAASDDARCASANGTKPSCRCAYFDAQRPFGCGVSAGRARDGSVACRVSGTRHEMSAAGAAARTSMRSWAPGLAWKRVWPANGVMLRPEDAGMELRRRFGRLRKNVAVINSPQPSLLQCQGGATFDSKCGKSWPYIPWRPDALVRHSRITWPKCGRGGLSIRPDPPILHDIGNNVPQRPGHQGKRATESRVSARYGTTALGVALGERGAKTSLKFAGPRVGFMQFSPAAPIR